MQSLFGAYLKENPPKETEAYELKITKHNSLPFKDVKEHQVEALLKTEGKGLYHRITDQPWIENRPYSYTLKKPFDCFCLVNAKAYVVVWYYKPRQPKVFLKIRIQDFLKFKRLAEKAGFKSLKEQMAQEIASETLNISSKKLN